MDDNPRATSLRSKRRTSTSASRTLSPTREVLRVFLICNRAYGRSPRMSLGVRASRPHPTGLSPGGIAIGRDADRCGRAGRTPSESLFVELQQLAGPAADYRVGVA